jgi:tRNA pseudouridine55 synthase
MSGLPGQILPTPSTNPVSFDLVHFMQTSWTGLLNIYKPHDMTSRDVVNHVQRLVRPAKAGHAGTLDPLATGVLVVCVGSATRLIEYVQEQPKTYLASFLLGRESETEDVESPAIELVDPPQPSRSEVETVLPQFLGQILQRPPAYSALKVGGKRAYALARRGQTVELAPRPIVIHRLVVRDYVYPRLSLEVECGSGTYIRSLGRDLAAALGTAAVMSELERTAIGRFTVSEACHLSDLTSETLAARLLPPLRAVEQYPQLVLQPAEIADLFHGRPVRTGAEVSGLVAVAVDQHENGKMLGLVRALSPGLWQPFRNLVDPPAT